MVPPACADRPFQAHDRLIKSAGLSGDERRALLRDISARVATATAPVKVLMPVQGVAEWDRPGQPAHDPEGLVAMRDEMRSAFATPVGEVEVAGHH